MAWVFLVLLYTLQSYPVTSLPQGKYTLPKPTTGCPTSGDLDPWKEALLRVRMQPSVTYDLSESFHWLGVPVQQEPGDSILSFYFCVHDEDTGDLEWPSSGDYCVFRHGGVCPTGLTPIDDEFLPASQVVTVEVGGPAPVRLDPQPGGTRVVTQLCCAQGTGNLDVGTVSSALMILTPPGQSICPEVKATTGTVEYLDMNDPDDTVHRLCYYEPVTIQTGPACKDGWVGNGDFCYTLMENMRSWATSREMCMERGGDLASFHSLQEYQFLQSMSKTWSQVLVNKVTAPYHPDNFTFWIGLADLEARSSYSWSDGSDKTSFSCWNPGEPRYIGPGWKHCVQLQKSGDSYHCYAVQCGETHQAICKKPRLTTTEVIPLKSTPTRQSSTLNGLKSDLAVYNSHGSEGCAVSMAEDAPWWQLDLMQDYRVAGLQLFIDHVYLSSLSVTITVGPDPDSYKRCTARVCVNKQDISTVATVIRCPQATEGRYITIQALGQQVTLGLCQVKIYGQKTSCSRPLGVSTGEVPDVNMNATTWHVDKPPHNARLGNSVGWCAYNNDRTPTLKVVFPRTVRINKVRTEGSPKSDDHVSSFILKFRNSAGNVINYVEEGATAARVFVSESERTHTLYTPVETSELHLEVRRYEGQACLRMEVFGCLANNNDECGEYQQGLHTTFMSPRYPSYYGSALTCSWLFEAPQGQTLYLDFTDVHLSSGSVISTSGWDNTICTDTIDVEIKYETDSNWEVLGEMSHDHTKQYQTLRKYAKVTLNSCARTTKQNSKGFKLLLQHEDMTPCTAGWTMWNMYCYKLLSKESANWKDSRNLCMNEGGDLASYSSRDEKDAIAKMLADWEYGLLDTSKKIIDPYTQFRYWIALEDKGTEGTLMFADGRPYEHALSYFLPGQPDDFRSSEDCVEMMMTTSIDGVANDDGCWVNKLPFCKKQRVFVGKSIEMAGKPTRQSSNKDGQLADRGNDELKSLTCAHTYRNNNPWWQIDLLVEAEIEAVRFTSKLTGPIHSIHITVGSSKDAFLRGEALTCVQNVTNDGREGFVVCNQKVKGQYVTLMKVMEDSELSVCDLELFGRYTGDGRPLGISNAEVSAANIVGSSWTEDRYPHFGRLNNPFGWCAKTSDSLPTLQINFNGVVQISSLLVEGVPGYGYIEGFKLSYKSSAGIMVNSPQDFMYNGTLPGQQSFQIVPAIRATGITIQVTSYTKAPCMTVEALGLIPPKTAGDTVTLNNNLGYPAVDLLHILYTSNVLAVLEGVKVTEKSYLVGLRYYIKQNYQNAQLQAHVYRPMTNITGYNSVHMVDLRSSTGDPVKVIELGEPFELLPGDIFGIYSAGPLFPIPFTTAEDMVAHGSELYTATFLKGGNVNVINRKDFTNTKSVAFAFTPMLSSSVITTIESSKCEFTITKEGLYTSPSYPHYYGSGLDCVWNIKAPPKKYVALYFVDFNLARPTTTEMTDDWLAGSCNDYVEVDVYDTKPPPVPTSRGGSSGVGGSSGAGGPAEDSGPGIATSPAGSSSGGRGGPGSRGGGGGGGRGGGGGKVVGTWKTTDHIEGDTLISRYPTEAQMRVRLHSCVRKNWMEFRGFTFNITFDEIPRCFVSAEECFSSQICTYPAAIINTPNYPYFYEIETRCAWDISAPFGTYILLTIYDFDMPAEESCTDSWFQIYDGGRGAPRSAIIGMYCNQNPPPPTIATSWNLMRMNFKTDQVLNGRGFTAKYESLRVGLSPELMAILNADNGTMCRKYGRGWKYFLDACYKFEAVDKGLTWFEAESACQNYGGHLVSIMTNTEVLLLHYLLTNDWLRNSVNTYIGLTDEGVEGQFRWSDGRPLVFAKWAYDKENQIFQPDGGINENCGMIEITSLHIQDHWNDVPCSYDGVNQYVCKISLHSREPDPDPWGEPPTSNTTLTPCPEETWACDNGECVLESLYCDGKPDCRDGSDEVNCSRECLPSQRPCNDGTCLPVSYFCDFKTDCFDASDENFCEYPQCDSTQFTCDNKQCIPIEKRCDSLEDCLDGSDEQHCDGACSLEYSFVCYSGLCRPRHTYCDRLISCPGKTYEDDKGCPHTPAQSCSDLYLFGYPSGYYVLRPMKLGPVTARCGMRNNIATTTVLATPTTGLVSMERGAADENSTLVEHYFEISFDDAFMYRDQGMYLVKHSDRCSRTVQVQCDQFCVDTAQVLLSTGETINQLTYLVDVCLCSISGDVYGASTQLVIALEGASAMNMEALVLHGRTLGDNSSVGLDVGAVACVEDISEKERPGYFRCQNGQYIDSKYLCVLDYDEFGVPLGCNDATHLIGCDEMTILDQECISDGTYKGTQFRTVSGTVCQSWYVQSPHAHKHNVGLSENFCRMPERGDKQPWCYTTNSAKTTEVCDVKTCNTSVVGKKAPFKCPSDHYQCPTKYCIPLKYVCDGEWHCSNGEEEMNCDDYECPGKYKCRGSVQCLSLDQVCDGAIQCPQGDDESYCDMLCPPGCLCSGLSMDCSNAALMDIPQNTTPRSRKLDFRGNEISVLPMFLAKFYFLVDFNVAGNKIITIPDGLFRELNNLVNLDLSFNRIMILQSHVFTGLVNLKVLNIIGNEIGFVEPNAFDGVGKMTNLDLSGQGIKEVKDDTFRGLAKLKYLDLRSNQIELLHAKAFGKLPDLQNLHLSQNQFINANATTFSDVQTLQALETDHFKFCCMATQVEFSNCLPEADEISSCQDLMQNNALRAFLWIIGLVSLLGNTGVIAWRLTSKIKTVHELLIMNLGMSDILMGIYMICVGAVDAYYRGVYIEHADNWKQTGFCWFMGFLATCSSEGSVMFLVIISVDRLINIVFPLTTKKLNMHRGKVVCGICWLIALFIAIFPLVKVPYFEDSFYARSGVCLALPLTRQRLPGWEYSAAIFVAFNLAAFLTIVSSYTVMYFVIQKGAKKFSGSGMRNQVSIARKMMLVVFSDFACWFPIILMGIIALAGYPMPGGVYAWVIVFVLPVNSALNPVLYTVAAVNWASLPCCKKEVKKGAVSRDFSSTSSTRNTYAYDNAISELLLFSKDVSTMDSSSVRLTKALNQGDLGIKDIHSILVKLTKTLVSLHASGMSQGDLEASCVFLKGDTKNMDVFMSRKNTATPADIAAAQGQDINKLGLLAKKLLQRALTQQTDSV